MMDILLKMLQKTNLTPIEAEVYLSALQSKKGTAYDISRSLKTRSSVYGTLEKLKRRGLITEQVHKEKRVYVAKDIRAFIEEKKEENEIIYRNILSFAPSFLANKHTTIKIFKGEKELLYGLRYGLNPKTDVQNIYCIYPSSSKMTISPKDTLYYNFNLELAKKHYKKIILSDTQVRSEYAHLDASLGFERHISKHPLFSDISKLAIGLELFEQEGILKVIFYKETMILSIENRELVSFATSYFKNAIL